MNKRALVPNVVAVARIAKLYGLPVILSTVNVETGLNKPTIAPITDVLPGVQPIDRTSINGWEDEDFVAAVAATGRKNLIMVALWTEVCLVFPALDALHDGFDVYPVVDAVAGTSEEAHRAGLQRIVQAGGNRQLDPACLRAAARLASRRHGGRLCRDRVHRIGEFRE